MQKLQTKTVKTTFFTLHESLSQCYKETSPNPYKKVVIKLQYSNLCGVNTRIKQTNKKIDTKVNKHMMSEAQ